MAIEIPNAELGATFTNDITGVTYTYDGQKWIAEGGAAGSHEHEHDHDEEYVNVEGDEMSGGLKVKYKADEGSMGIGVARTSYEDAEYESRVQASILYAQNDGNTKFRVTNKGQVQAGQDASQAFIATADNDLTTKKYVDNRYQNIFTYSFSGFNHGHPASLEQADLLKGQFYIGGGPDESTFAYFHEEALEGKLLSLPCHSSAGPAISITIFEQGVTYPLNSTYRKTQPDGRLQTSYRYTTQIKRLEPPGFNGLVVPIWSITTNSVWGSWLELNKKYDIQFSFTLM